MMPGLPAEILCVIFLMLDTQTLLTIPQVCTFWRGICYGLADVRLDFEWLTQRVAHLCVQRSVCARSRRVNPTTFGSVLARFPGTTRVSIYNILPLGLVTPMGREGGVLLTDAGVLVLADKCRGLKRATFNICYKLTDAAVLGLAAKCRGLTHASFRGCEHLTDAAVLGLAAKCRGLMHANFDFCSKLTDAAVLALAAKCSGLTRVSFGHCPLLTDAAVIALADNCRGLTHIDFGFCGKLTDAAVIALADNCRGLTDIDFRFCRKLTDAAVLKLTSSLGLPHVHAPNKV